MQDIFQQWVMGTAQDQGIDIVLHEGRQILFGAQFRDRMPRPAFFCQGNKQGTSYPPGRN
jgi:hypothetical protein